MNLFTRTFSKIFKSSNQQELDKIQKFIEAINNKENDISFISTGGGALLHLIGNGYLPALKILRAID